MKNYVPTLPKKIDEFVDRTEIRDNIMNIIKHQIQKKNFFKVISIYGMGGIGKTCLINEIEQQTMKIQGNYKIIKVSFEISKSRLFLENLVKISNKYDKPCILFNYALLKYHQLVDIYQLDSSVLNGIQESFISDFLDTCSQLANYVINIADISSIVAGIPSVSNTLNVFGIIRKKIGEHPFKEMLNLIDTLTAQELLSNLPIYLGMDINRNEEYLSCKKTKRYTVFIFDSYNPSTPYSESLEWLERFIGSLHAGLFIITSREAISWEDADRDIIPYELKSYPEHETRKYLSKYVHNEEIIDTIIESTECVPIYVDLALNIYIKELDFGKEHIINKSIFEDRETLTLKFINHLKPEWQEVIFNLATVRVFNKEIFKHIITSCNLSCPYSDYYELVNVSLVKYVENTKSLVKLHDVFCKNVTKVLNVNQVMDNLESYLDFIIKRETYHNTNEISTIIILFINIINIENDFSESILIPTSIIEKTLDLFFLLFDTGVDFQLIYPKHKCNVSISDMLYFICAIQVKKRKTRLSIQFLDKISTPNNLGNHKKSYEVFKLYTLSLTGNYVQLAKGLKALNRELDSRDLYSWYYAQAKLYIADLNMMEGLFFDAIKRLGELQKVLDNSIYSFYNSFQIHRTRGHIYRFNLLFDKACNEYNQVFEEYDCGIATKAYIYTNLIETKCYYDTNYVDNNFEMTLSLVKQDHQKKNEAKLYYSKAISETIKKEYKNAKKYIEKSIDINKKDGYLSGELFAYMAQAYLDFALHLSVSRSTLKKIYSLLKINKVYSFFLLPLAIIQNDQAALKRIQKNFDWLDYETTKYNYIDFLNKLKK